MAKTESEMKKLEGIVEEALPGLTFRVKVFNSEKTILAHLRGKMKMYRIKVVPGDRVLVEVSPHDETRGRIMRRL